MCFVSKIEVLSVSIDDKLNFNHHLFKPSAQISALRRLTRLIDLPSRKAIYSFKLYCRKFQFTERFFSAEKVLIWLKKFKNGHSDLFSGTKYPAMMSFWKTLVMNSSESTRSHVWNILPVHFKSCESISEFKNRIKHWAPIQYKDDILPV